MFTWVTQGVAEPYIPANKQESIKRVTPSYQGVPDKSIRVNEEPHKRSKNTLSILPGSKTDPYTQDDLKPEESAIPVFAREIMSPAVITANISSTLSEAEHSLLKNKIKYLPILSRERKILGIVSQKDILSYMIYLYRKSPMDIEKAQVGDIMITKILTAYPDTAIREIAKIMFEERIGALPIISRESSELLGILTRSDILKSVMQHTSMNLYI
jgi:acetoin utilization protein AcuB